ncbi:MAG: helix-turn-helix domain-containing protein, partial [Proteobacteria bacterium]|nr:helix-turn-helix domain-containing protein [Pseudomonadota bacterium]
MTTKVQSLDRAFDILELISNERRGLALSEISSKVSLPRSTTYRLLASLQGRGYIEKDPVS